MGIFEHIAQEYVDSLEEVLPGYKFHFDDRKDFFFKIYYDFVFIDLQGNIPKEPPVVGGAVGFTIDKKTHKIEMLSWADLGLLEKSQKEIEDVYEKVNNIGSNPESLFWLKSKYDLNSSTLLKIKRVLKNTNFTKENVIEELYELIRKNRQQNI